MPFDIGFLELCLVAIISLLVLGPERLPVAARTLGTWIGKAKHAFSSVKDEINRELQIEELRKQIKDQQDKVEQLVNTGQESIDDFARTTQSQIEETREAFQKEMEQQTIHPQPTQETKIDYSEENTDADEPVELVEYEPLPNAQDNSQDKITEQEQKTETTSPVENKP